MRTHEPLLATARMANSTVVFITGATQGIGLQIARVLSTRALHPGYHVIIGALSDKEGQNAVTSLLAENPSRVVSTVTMDVTSDESIEEAVKSIAKSVGHIDVLFNNAGVLLDDMDDPRTPRATFKKTFEVNVFGAAAVTEACIFLLEKSVSTPRIVFMVSRLGSLATNSDVNDRSNNRWFPAYRSSKCALNMLMLHYSRLFLDKGWKVNGCCPGLVKTDMTSAQDDSIKCSLEQGALNAVRLSTLGTDGPTGSLTSVEGNIKW